MKQKETTSIIQEKIKELKIKQHILRGERKYYEYILFHRDLFQNGINKSRLILSKEMEWYIKHNSIKIVCIHCKNKIDNLTDEIVDISLEIQKLQEVIKE
ncbi:hypothetical protein [uncultured Brachyspira sp.]|uniref:hypothetical protein n=1 Tax=uncultured Brachyspira sp. TaxID=221953 RepID=UPI002608B39F|nr:hypothetical protein [uncultured Brachyspira sp.]